MTKKSIDENIKFTLIKRNKDILYVLFHDEKEIKEITNEDFNAKHIVYILPVALRTLMLEIFMKATGLTEKALLERVTQKSMTVNAETNHMLQCQECGGTDINRKGLCRHCGIATKKEV